MCLYTNCFSGCVRTRHNYSEFASSHRELGAIGIDLDLSASAHIHVYTLVDQGIPRYINFVDLCIFVYIDVHSHILVYTCLYQCIVRLTAHTCA